MDDDRPLVRPIKTAFAEIATVHAEALQKEVEAGRMSSDEAAKRLTEIMSRNDMLKAVIAVCQANQTKH